MGKRTIPREAFALHEKRSAKVKVAVVNYIKEHSKTKNPALFLSSGADSHLILFAALHAGKRPTIYSCTLDGQESQDFKGARNTAKLFGLDFVPVALPVGVKHLMSYVQMMYNEDINPGIIVNKTVVECLWPVAHMLKAAQANGHKEVLTGFNGDTWYCTLRSHKKAYLRGAYHTEVIETFRKNFIANNPDDQDPKNWQGRDPHQVMRLGWMRRYTPTIKRLIMPFNDPVLFNIMDKMDPIKEGWKPIQKAPWRLAFWEEFEKARASVYVHVPLQKGDSGIEEHFHKLLDTKLNTRGYKSTIGIYNDQLRLWRTRNTPD